MNGLRCLLVLLLCTTSPLIYSAASVQTVSAWGPECEHNPDKDKPGAGIAVAILAPIVIEAVVDHAAASLKAASDSEVVQFPAVSEIGSLYEINKIGETKLGRSAKCLTIVRAEYASEGVPNNYMTLEIGLQKIPGSNYFRLEPYYFRADKLEAGNWMSKTGDYSISVSLYAFGSTTPFGSATFNFQKVKQGTEMLKGDSRLLAASSDPIAFPSDLEDVKVAQEAKGKQIGPYLLALGILKRNEKLNGVDKAILTPKPNQYGLPSVANQLFAYCAEESNRNALLPEKARVRSQECAIKMNEAKRSLDIALNNADRSTEVLSWADAICVNWKSSKKCSVAIDDPDKFPGEPTGYFYSKTVITETRNANVYGQKVAAILGAASDDIKKELKSKLPDAKEAQDEQEDHAERKTNYEYGLAMAKLKSAQNSYNISTDAARLDAFIAVVEACYMANEAAVVVGKPSPCPHYE